jgi:hypothetical protein
MFMPWVIAPVNRKEIMFEAASGCLAHRPFWLGGGHGSKGKRRSTVLTVSWYSLQPEPNGPCRWPSDRS